MYPHWQSLFWYALGIVQAVTIAAVAITATSTTKLVVVAACIPLGVVIGTVEAGIWETLTSKLKK